MIARNWKSCSPAVAFGLLASNTVAPFSYAEGIAPTIGVITDSTGHPVSFEVAGLSVLELGSLDTADSKESKCSEFFTVHVRQPGDDELPPPMFGTYSIDGNRLSFMPRYPLRAGVTYRAVLKVKGTHRNRDSSALAITIHKDITVPESGDADIAPTTVQTIYPSSDVLPENQLRFYIQFSSPMTRNQIYRNLELLDESGQPVEAAFLEIGEELWDPSGKRFTLLLDPGRVKRGLVPRQELGPVLEQGKKYTLRVKHGLRDARGKLLVSDYQKSFTVGPAFHQAIDVAHWKLSTPLAGTRNPLTVEFPQFLDHGLLQRTLRIVDPDEQTVPGKSVIGPAEQSWKFAPTVNWISGTYHVLIDTVLEDSAGNSVIQPFEIDGQKPLARSVSNEPRRLTFSVSESESTAATPARVKSDLQSQEVRGRVDRK